MMTEDVHESYNPQRILLSFAISFIGAYMATSLCEQLRAYYIHHKQTDVWIPTKWFALMGISLGGVGIWCMHFIGMSSLTLNHGHTEMYYHIGTSIASLIVVIFTTTLGVLVSSMDPMFLKTKGEILEMFIQDTSQLSIAEIRKIKNARLLWIISTKSLKYLLLGGLIEGSGVCIMHYIGMQAMSFNGRIEWNAGVVAASVIIALLASSAAFWILFRLLSLFPNKEILRLSSSFVMAVAVCGMHYTGMMAADMKWNSLMKEHEYAAGYIHPKDAFFPVLIAALITIAVITIVLLEDLRKLVNTLPTGNSQGQRYGKSLNSSLQSAASLKPQKKSHQLSLTWKFSSLKKGSSKVGSVYTTQHTVSTDATDLSLKMNTTGIAEEEV